MKKFYLLLTGCLLSLITFGQYLAESFENVWSGTPAAPTGWVQVTGIAGTGSGSDLSWEQAVYSGSWLPAGNGTSKPAGAQNGTSVAHYNDFNAQSGQTDTLKTGTIDLSGSTNPRVSFYYFYNSGSALLKVLASADGVTNWTDLTAGGIGATGANWIKFNYNLSAYNTATMKIAFVVVASWGNQDLWLDNISVTETPVPLAGTYTIDNTLPTGGANFISFTDAINSLNDAGISSSVTFNITAGQVFTEETPVITATGTAANTITFQKSGSGNNPVISSTGLITTLESGIYLRGGDYFTFDGVDVNITSGNYLDYGYYISNASATDGAQYNTIKNCKVVLNRSNNQSRGIFQYYGAASATNATGTNSNNTYQNIIIENVYQGIYLNATSTTYPDDNCIVTGCTIGASTADDIGGGGVACYALRASFPNNIIVTNNIVRNIKTTSQNVGGIFIESAKGTLNIASGNYVHNILTASTSASVIVYGIRAEGSASSDKVSVLNNMIYGLSHGITSPSTTISLRALAINIGGNGISDVFYNTVYLNGGSIAGSTTFYINGAATHTIQNNIFYNASPGGATSKRYCIYRAGGGTLVSNYNNLLNVAGTNNFTGYNTTDKASLADWQASTGTPDLNSVSVDPMFVSATDLHFRNFFMNNLGTPVTGITTDYDGETRNVTTPDIGADEYEDIILPVATYNPVSGTIDVPVSTTIDVTYSENIRNLDNSAIDNTNVANLVTFTNSVPANIPFTATWDAVNNKINIVPDAVLSASTQFTVSVAGIEDTWNNTDGGSSTSFTTGTADAIPPVIDSIIVYNTNPADVIVFFNENVKLTNANGIMVSINGSSVAVNSVAGVNTGILTFTLATAVLSHDTVKFSYDPISGDLTDITGNELALITDLLVTNRVVSSAKDITAFSIVSPVVDATISVTNIIIMLPFGTDVTALTPVITVSDYATVSPASGVVQNFTSPVTYTVTAEDGTTKIYTATVNYYYDAPYTQDFTGAYPPANWFEATGNAPSPLTGASSWVASTGFANTGTNPGIKMNLWGTDNDWIISPVINLGTGGYRLKHDVAATNWNGTNSVTMSAEDTVFVLISTDPYGGTWNFTGVPAYYTTSNSPVNTGVEERFDISAYTGHIRVAYYAKGIGNTPDMDIHFDNMAVYVPDTSKDITAFDFISPAATGVIAGPDITLNVPAGTDVTNLVPTISVSAFATVSPLSGVAQDFTNPVTYTVTAEDGSTNVYTVTVTVDPLTVIISPADGSVNVPVNTNITLTFNAAIRNLDNTVVDDTNAGLLITLKTPDALGTDVPFTASINPGKTVITVTPSSFLAYNTTYYMAIGATVEEINNLAIAGSASSFATMGSPDVTAPTVQSAIVENAAPSDIVVTFDELVTLTGASGFAFTVDGTPVAVNAVTGAGSAVLTFTLASPVPDHVTVTMDYVSATGNVTDLAVVPNPLTDITAYPVTNNVMSAANDILTFAFVNPAVNAIINGTNITAVVPAGTDITNLNTVITVSGYATINPSSGVAGDFTNPVTYTVTAENGTTKDYFVFVSVIQDIPYIQDFEASFPPAFWNINNPDSDITWQQATVGGNGPGTNAVFVDFWNYTPAAGQLDDMVSPVFDFTNHTPVLTFKVAYKLYTGSADSLKVFISTDGGLIFNTTPLFVKGGTDLLTVPASNGVFSPDSANHWRTETIDLSSYTGSNVVLKFQAINDYGNNLFVDDIKLFDPPTASIAGTATICNGDSTALTFTLTGSAPWVVVGNDGTGNATFNFSASPAVVYAQPLVNTTFSLVSVSDANGEGTVSGTAIITVTDTPVVTVADPAAVCAPGTVDLTSAVTGNTNNGALTYWTDITATTELADPSAVSTSGTYYIKTENSCGNDMKPVVITIHDAPDATITAPVTTICNGDSAALYFTFSGAAPWSFIGDDGSGQVTFTNLTNPDTIWMNPVINTTYSVISVTDNNNCTLSIGQDFAIVVNDVPVLTVTDPAAVCEPETVDITSANVITGNTYNGTLSYWSDATATIPVSNPAALDTGGVYYIQSANSCGSDIKPVTVTVNPVPVVSVESFTDPTSCGATDGQVSVTDNASYTYLWNTVPVQTTATASALTAGNYQVSVTLNSCPVILNQSLNDATAAVITLAGDTDNMVCEGEPVTFTADGLTNGSYEFYVDNLSAGTVVYPQNSYTASSVTNGMSVYVIATDGNCTSVSNTVVTTVYPLPSAVMSVSADTICPGNTAQLELTATGTAPWTVNGSVGITPFSLVVNASPYSLPVNPVQTTSYTLNSVTDANGCASQVNSTLVIVVVRAPELTINDPADVCSPATVDITSSSVIIVNTNNGALSYWEDASAITPVTDPTAIAAGGTYYIKSSNLCGSTIQPVSVVINNGSPVLTVTDPSEICEPLTVDLTSGSIVTGNTNNGTLTYWGDTAGTVAIADPTAISSGGIYYVKSENSCGFDMQPVNVIINQAPALTIADPLPACPGGTVDITSPTVITGSTGTITFWEDSAATITLANPSVVGVAGAYYIQGANTCGSVIEPVNVTFTDVPALTISDPFAVCPPAVVDITSPSVITGNTNNGTLSYWEDAGATTPVSNPAAIDINGTFYIQSSNSCGSDLQPVSVVINPLPAGAISIQGQSSICNGDSTFIEMAFTGTAPWSFTADDGSGQQVFTTPFTPAGFFVHPDVNTTYTLVSVTDGNGCTAQVNQNVSVNVTQIPVVYLGADTTICQDNADVLVLDAGTSGSAYLWDDNSTNQTLTVISANETIGVHTYYVTVSNGSCESADSINVMVDICNKIPQLSITGLKVYPNPTKGQITITAPGYGKGTEIVIVNTDGQMIFTGKTDDNLPLVANLSKYPKGVYLLKIKTGNFVKMERIIVQ